MLQGSKKGSALPSRLSVDAVNVSTAKKETRICVSTGDHIGITYDGTFAEYVLLPAELVHPLADNISFVDAAVMEPLSLAVRSIEHVSPNVGDTAVIIGPGSVGLLHLQGACCVRLFEDNGDRA